MAVFGPFCVNDSGEEGECGQGKENQSQLGRTVAETGRRDGNRRERMTEWEEEKRKRVRRGLEKRKSGIGKEGEEDGHRAAYSLKQEGTICLQFCCVISKKAVGTE
ncbi:MAG: hypothetical protein SO049_00065 [Prevotella sp.]|nr:hypothetical protein [Prevotella sp.]